MDTENLVILKENICLITNIESYMGSLPQTKSYGKYLDSVFEPNKFYRCLPENGTYMINMEYFSQAEYDKYFELAIDKVKRDFEKFGLCENGIIISYSKFRTKFSDYVTSYGRGRDKIHSLFVGEPKKGMYQVVPTFRDTKAKYMKYAYDILKTTLEGNMEYLDSGYLLFGNSGYPIAYNEIYLRQYDYKKIELLK